MLARIAKLATVFTGCKVREPLSISRTIGEEGVQRASLPLSVSRIGLNKPGVGERVCRKGTS